MKDRFNQLGTAMLGALCLLSTCGITYSCSDNDLDEKKPAFLGASIYDELNNRTDRTFKTTIRLVNDLGYKDVLSKTGSLTLFVADDKAYEHFFQTTTWKDGNGNPIRSYDQLSTNQKRVLLNNSMLNNAYVMEKLSNTENNGKNLCLRQVSNATATDTVPYWRWYQLPENLNQPDADGTDDTGDTKYWNNYRREARGGIYMAVDATNPMMTHFLEGNMNEKKVKHDDVAFILNLPNGSWPETENRSYIYNRRVVEQDVTCLNGYYHVLDSVLVTPPNMAEVIRTNGDTKYFNALLDRFSAPYFSRTLTDEYSALHNINGDSIFQKRYISSNSQGNVAIALDPKGKSLGDFPKLGFDPAWNTYAISSSTKKENDMAAMFVPSDKAMKEYFLNGGGRVLINRYGKKANTEENLLFNIQQIPLSVIQALVNNLMKDSYAETVPSKYLTIMNDAQDQMFPATTYGSEAAYKNLFEKTLLANNGVVYIMNTVITPADYAAVIAPAILQSNTKVIRSVLRADEPYIDGTSYTSAPLKQYFSTYLKAMQSRFSFFVPTDDGLAKYGYVDPVSMSSGIPSNRRYWTFEYGATSATDNSPRLPIKAIARKYNPDKDRDASVDGQVTGRYQSLPNDVLDNSYANNDYGATKRELLIEMVNQHIVVHENNDTRGMNAGNRFFTSRSGAPIYLAHAGDANNNGRGMKVEGGLQLDQNSDASADNNNVSTVTEGFDMTSEKNGYGNGMTYLLDRPMQPTMNSVFAIMRDHSEFSQFYDLCNFFDSELLQKAGFKDSINGKANEAALWNNEQNKYRIFVAEDNAGNHPANGEKLVRFFNNYRYTIYIPTNAAMAAAVANGLPTWTSIQNYLDANTDAATGVVNSDAKIKAQAMIVCLVNFLKYHFQDNAFYVDNATNSGTYQTSCIDNDRNVYMSIGLKQTTNAIELKDLNGDTRHVIAPYNLVARDMNFDRAPSNMTQSRYVKVSSYAAIHQIDGVLNFMKLKSGRYDSAWTTSGSARRFVAKYRPYK